MFGGFGVSISSFLSDAGEYLEDDSTYVSLSSTGLEYL